jgi:hypothetical protein
VPTSHCKQLDRTWRGPPIRGLRTLLATGLATTAMLSACGTHPRLSSVAIRTLETAQAVQPARIQRTVVSDAAGLGKLCYPIGRRLGLLQVRSAKDWQTVRMCAPELGPPPDFSQGIVIGLLSQTGQPLNGEWPIRLESVRIHDGVGLALAHFKGGSFLPNQTTYLEMAQIHGLASLEMIDVDGARFRLH